VGSKIGFQIEKKKKRWVVATAQRYVDIAGISMGSRSSAGSLQSAIACSLRGSIARRWPTMHGWEGSQCVTRGTHAVGEGSLEEDGTGQ
jgi:hypothetical protein